MATEKEANDIEKPYDNNSETKGDFATGTSKDVDVAATFLATLDASVKETPISDKEAKTVLWKIDLAILPILAVSVIIAAVDKVVISNAAIYGMKADTNLSGSQYSWVGR